MGPLLLFLGFCVLALLITANVSFVDGRRKAALRHSRELASRSGTEALIGTSTIQKIETELRAARAAGVPLDIDVVQLHVDEYHARIRELYRKELPS